MRKCKPEAGPQNYGAVTRTDVENVCYIVFHNSMGNQSKKNGLVENVVYMVFNNSGENIKVG